MENKILTLEQLTALRLFASAHGRNWKSELRQAWMTGNYPTGSTLPYLQQIRNEFGPTWLVRFSLKADKRLASPTPKTFPEINAIATVAECDAALRMGYNTLDNVKAEHQQDLRDRLEAIEERRRRLIETNKRRQWNPTLGPTQGL